MSANRFEALPLSSPVFAAAGCAPLTSLLQEDGLGGVVTPSYLWRGRTGPSSHVRETAAGLLFRPSPATPGIREAVRRSARAWGAAKTHVIVSLLVDERGGYIEAAGELEGARGPAAVS